MPVLLLHRPPPQPLHLPHHLPLSRKPPAAYSVLALHLVPRSLFSVHRPLQRPLLEAPAAFSVAPTSRPNLPPRPQLLVLKHRRLVPLFSKLLLLAVMLARSLHSPLSVLLLPHL